MMKRTLLFRAVFITLTAAALSSSVSFVKAQDAAQDIPQPIPLGISSPATDPAAAVVPQDPAAVTPDGATPTVPPIADGEINPNEIRSLLFTHWEHTVIVDAKRSRQGGVRPVTQEELDRALNNRETHKAKPPPEEREIVLSGIVFVHNEDWTIWLNGKRVTSKAIPKEVMDLKVYKEYVEMKWIDEYTNQIFPLRLRPHQRFNIDTRIFLPG